MAIKTDVNCSMYSYVKNSVKNANNPAIRFAKRTITYKKMLKKIDLMSKYLLSVGLKKGDEIAIALPNIPTQIYILYGANRLGIKVNLIHPLLSPNKILLLSENSKLLFLFDKILNKNVECYNSIYEKIIVCQAQDCLTAFENIFYNIFTLKERNNIKNFKTYKKEISKTQKNIDIDCTVNEDDYAIIMHSSGTTDTPKSLELTNKQFNIQAEAIFNALCNVDYLPKRKGMLTALPMFHAFGLGVCVHCSLSNDLTSVLVAKYSPKKIISYIKHENVTILAGVPTMYSGIVNNTKIKTQKLKKVLFAFCGGDKLDLTLKAKFDNIFKSCGSKCILQEGYGLTEVAGVFSVNTTKDNREKSVGKPLIEEYQIEAFSSDNTKLERNKKGKLYISAPTAITNYIGYECDTIKTDDRNWIYTGDYGYVDNDGFIFFEDRLKRIIKVSGYLVYPNEIENVIKEIDGVEKVVAVGKKHEYKGMVVVCFVKTDNKLDKTAVKDSIISKCLEKLDKWSAPKEIIFLEKFPINIYGKTDTQELEKMLYSNTNS